MKLKKLLLLLTTVPVLALAHPGDQNQDQQNPTLPDSYDLREEVGELTPIAQPSGICFTSWATTTLFAMEAAIQKTEGIQVDLSEQYLITHNQKNYGCNGGYVAFGALITPGAVLQKHCPNTSNEEPCKSDAPIFRRAKGQGKVSKLSAGINIEEIKKAVYQFGSVWTGMDASVLKGYKGGIIKQGGGPYTNHPVNIIGWNDKEQYWIARNSWGPKWGEEGYFRIHYGLAHIGEEAYYLIY